GASMANYLALAALVGPGDEVVIERPTYEPLVATASWLGATIKRFDRRREDGFAIDADAVARAVGPRTRAVVVSNLHNPSGVLSALRDRARTLLDANRALVDDFLAARRDLEAVRPPHGTIVFPRLVAGDVDALCARLRDHYETTVVPGRFFELPSHFRLGLGGPTADLREGLTRLAAALDER